MSRYDRFPLDRCTAVPTAVAAAACSLATREVG